MQQWMDIITWLVMVFWIGGMMALGILLAPVAFRQLQSRSDAGRVVGAALSRLETVGLVSSGVLLMATLVQAMDRDWLPVDLIRVLLVLAMLALTLVGALLIRPRLDAARAQLPSSFDQVPEDDPARLEHRRLHGLSVLVFQVALLMGLALVVLSAIR